MEGIEEPVEARISRIAPAAEPGTRSIGVTLVVDNPKETFRAGQYAVAKVVLPDDTQRLTVPMAAVSRNSGQEQVWMIENGALVRRIVTNDDHASFELSEDLSSHHHHLICTTCGAIEDFVVPEDVEEQLSRALAGAAKRHKFAVSGHTLDLFGTCRDCAA